MKKMYMIGNAHVDPVWLWRWQEGFQETKATFRSALDRLKEYESFVFTSSSAAFYEWIEENDKQMFEEIKERIAEGRWVLCGGWWIQPDCNLPGGESFVRQGLLGQRYFEKKFGVTAKVGYNVDSFGHHGMLPQILKKSGMDAYVFMRPGPDEKGLPSRLFIWESDDGSRVTAFRIPFEYATFGNVEDHIKWCKREFSDSFDQLMCFYGVGNHGGGPTKENLDTILRLKEEDSEEAIHMSSPNEFFQDIRENGTIERLPVVHDDLQHHASGCYSVHSEVKRLNRQSEHELIMAEKFSSIAEQLTNQKYPEGFQHAWKGILFNQFHDILAGTSIESAYEDARDQYGEARSIASRGINYALQSISWNIGIEQEDGMFPIVVFNPHSWPSKPNVEWETGIFRNYGFPESFVIEDADGNEVAHQETAPIAKVPGRRRVTFTADLPPLGYTTYKIRPKSPKQRFTWMKLTDHSMENDRLRLIIDEKTGGIASLFDKYLQQEILKGPAALPCVSEDLSDTWGHGQLRFEGKSEVFKPVQIKVLEEGPVRGAIRVVSKYKSSTMTQDFYLYKQRNIIDVQVKVNWQEQMKVLILCFPVNLDHRKATYEIPYGHIERETNGEEEPMQNWFDLTGTLQGTKQVYGLSVINDGKYSGSVDKNVLNLTVLRSPVYAHHAPYEIDADEEYDFIDQGIQTFTYRLLPHEESWKEAGTVQHALELNQKAPVVVETYHEGSLPQTDSFIQIEPSHIVLTALKKAEEGEGYIARFHETLNQQSNALIRFPGSERKINLTFAPSEIKTIKIDTNSKTEMMETDLLEKPLLDNR